MYICTAPEDSVTRMNCAQGGSTETPKPSTRWRSWYGMVWYLISSLTAYNTRTLVHHDAPVIVPRKSTRHVRVFAVAHRLPVPLIPAAAPPMVWVWYDMVVVWYGMVVVWCDHTIPEPGPAACTVKRWAVPGSEPLYAHHKLTKRCL